MPKQNHKPRTSQCAMRPSLIKKLIVMPIARRFNERIDQVLAEHRRAFKKLNSIEDSIEIDARETARQLKQKE